MRRYARLLGVVAFLGILLIVFEASGLRDRFDLAFIQELILRHRVGGLLLFVLLFSLGNLIQIPGWLFLAAAVLTLGRTWGGVVTYVAAVTSCALTFVTIRSIGGDALRSIDNRIAVRILSQLDRHPIRSVALLRMLFQTAPAAQLRARAVGHRLASLSGRHAARPAAADREYCIFFDLLASGLHAR